MTKDLVKNLKFRAVEEGLDPARLSQYIEGAYKSRGKSGFKTKQSFSPSAIGYGYGTCPRYWYLVFNGADFEDNNTAQGIANMENGTFAHDRMQKLLESAGIVVATEREINLQDPPVRGFIDVIFDGAAFDVDDEIIGEFKTAKQEVFQIRKTQMKPSVNHTLQVLLYMHAEGRRYGVIIYENKNTQELLAIPVVMNERRQAILDETLEWMRLVRQTWENKTLPVRPFTKKSKQCKSCPIFTHCWEKEGEGDINVEAMSIPKL